MQPWLTLATARRPDRVAIETPDARLTYSELLARARATEPPPTIEHPPGIEFAVALHACLLHGVPAVPVDPRLSEAERTARRSVDARGALLAVHTSGSTGAPKPVHISAANVLANALGSAVALGLDPEERWLCPLPLSHVGGLMVLLRSVIYATTAVIAPADRIADGVTLASLVPTQLSRLLDAGLREPSRLRTVLLGGGPIAPALLERAAAAGVPVTPTYGLTEACSQVTVDGWPLPGVSVELAGDGEVLVSGPTVAGGGVLRTGDLGAFDDGGRLAIAGRKADTIVTGGENVAPAEVEAVLLTHADVLDAAVVGRDDPEWGEALVALIVPRPGRRVDADALRGFCRERLAGFKVPKRFEERAELSRTASGKLIRGHL